MGGAKSKRASGRASERERVFADRKDEIKRATGEICEEACGIITTTRGELQDFLQLLEPPKPSAALLGIRAAEVNFTEAGEIRDEVLDAIKGTSGDTMSNETALARMEAVIKIINTRGLEQVNQDIIEHNLQSETERQIKLIMIERLKDINQRTIDNIDILSKLKTEAYNQIEQQYKALVSSLDNVESEPNTTEEFRVATTKQMITITKIQENLDKQKELEKEIERNKLLAKNIARSLEEQVSQNGGIDNYIPDETYTNKLNAKKNLDDMINNAVERIDKLVKKMPEVIQDGYIVKTIGSLTIQPEYKEIFSESTKTYDNTKYNYKLFISKLMRFLTKNSNHFYTLIPFLNIIEHSWNPKNDQFEELYRIFSKNKEERDSAMREFNIHISPELHMIATKQTEQFSTILRDALGDKVMIRMEQGQVMYGHGDILQLKIEDKESNPLIILFGMMTILNRSTRAEKKEIANTLDRAFLAFGSGPLHEAIELITGVFVRADQLKLRIPWKVFHDIASRIRFRFPQPEVEQRLEAFTHKTIQLDLRNMTGATDDNAIAANKSFIQALNTAAAYINSASSEDANAVRSPTATAFLIESKLIKDSTKPQSRQKDWRSYRFNLTDFEN